MVPIGLLNCQEIFGDIDIAYFSEAARLDAQYLAAA